MVVVVEGEEQVVVVFPSLLPRRGILEAVWRGARGCLFEREMVVGKGVGGGGKGGGGEVLKERERIREELELQTE